MPRIRPPIRQAAPTPTSVYPRRRIQGERPSIPGSAPSTIGFLDPDEGGCLLFVEGACHSTRGRIIVVEDLFESPAENLEKALGKRADSGGITGSSSWALTGA